MAELQQILDRRRSAADQNIYQVSGGRTSRKEQENLAFRSGWSSTPGCAGRNSLVQFTPRGSVKILTPRADDNNLQGVSEQENTSDCEVEVDTIKSEDAQPQQALDGVCAERDAAKLDAATVRDELAKAREEIDQLRESLRRMNEQPLEVPKLVEIKEDDSAFVTAAFGVFDLLDLDEDGQLSSVDVQVFAELMTPPKDPQGSEVLCQKIWQQFGKAEQKSMGRSQWLQLVQGNGALGKALTIVDLERLVSSLEALMAAGMRRF